MLKRNSILIYSLLIASGIFGTWLVGLFGGETKPEDLSGLDTLLSLAGFLIFFGAIVGIIIVFSRTRPPMTKKQGIAWEQIRVGGKRQFIRNFVTKLGVPIILGMSLLTFRDYWTDESFVESLEIYGILSAITLVGLYFVAIRLWDRYERENRLLNSETQPNKSLDARAKQRLS